MNSPLRQGKLRLQRLFVASWLYEGAGGVVKFSVVFVSVAIAALSLAGCAANQASNGTQAYASARGPQAAAKTSARDPWTLPTPFGMFYSEVPRQEVAYQSNASPGSIIVDTKNRYLYYVTGKNQAIRYSIAVGAEGYGWHGTSTVSMKREWPSWTPTPGELKRFPDLPRYMEGGPENPLGARALYLGSSLYRIHGTNEPWKIGAAVSSGCIRMSNNDAIDLYDRAKVGATVIVR
jgi:lipoprotein-anchoring transpeptidase ErfK/SrfK